MPNLRASKTPVSSARQKSVFLREWWLIEVEGDSKLGVGGFFNKDALETKRMRLVGATYTDKSSNCNTGLQVFCSAAITKRHNNNTLEAEDGIAITISGCINRLRTQHNGFPPEVCDRFLCGFPCNWEEYAATSFHENGANATKRSLPVSFDDLPVTHVRDLLMSTTGESEACAFSSIILRDILKQCGGDSINQAASPVNTSEVTSWNSTKTKPDLKQKDIGSLSDPTWKTTEKAQKTQSFSTHSRKKGSENPMETGDEAKQEDDGSLLKAAPKTTRKAKTTTRVPSKVKADVHKSVQAAAKLRGTAYKSPGQHDDPLYTPAVHKPSSRTRHAEECNTTSVSEHKRITRSQRRYSLRSPKNKL